MQLEIHTRIVPQYRRFDGDRDENRQHGPFSGSLNHKFIEIEGVH